MSALRRWWRAWFSTTETWVEYKWADQIGVVSSNTVRMTRHGDHRRFWWRVR